MIFARLVDGNFDFNEELLAIHPLTGGTKGPDIYEALNYVVSEFGNFKKCSCVVRDGAKAMVGNQNVTLRKGNHPGEAQVRSGQRKVLYRRERDSLEGPHDKAKIQRKALRRGIKLGLQQRYMFRKRKGVVEIDPTKVWSGTETEAELSRRRLGWKWAWWG